MPRGLGGGQSHRRKECCKDQALQGPDMCLLLELYSRYQVSQTLRQEKDRNFRKFKEQKNPFPRAVILSFSTISPNNRVSNPAFLSRRAHQSCPGRVKPPLPRTRLGEPHSVTGAEPGVCSLNSTPCCTTHSLTHPFISLTPALPGHSMWLGGWQGRQMMKPATSRYYAVCQVL